MILLGGKFLENLSLELGGNSERARARERERETNYHKIIILPPRLLVQENNYLVFIQKILEKHPKRRFWMDSTPKIVCFFFGF